MLFTASTTQKTVPVHRLRCTTAVRIKLMGCRDVLLRFRRGYEVAFLARFFQTTYYKRRDMSKTFMREKTKQRLLILQRIIGIMERGLAGRMYAGSLLCHGSLSCPARSGGLPALLEGSLLAMRKSTSAMAAVMKPTVYARDSPRHRPANQRMKSSASTAAFPP